MHVQSCCFIHLTCSSFDFLVCFDDVVASTPPKKTLIKRGVFVWVTCDLTRQRHPCKHRLLEISVFLRNLVKSRRHILITLTSRTKETGWMWWWRWNYSTLFLESPKLLFQSSESELRPHSKNHSGSPHRKHKKERSYRLRSPSGSFFWKRSVSKRQELLGSVLQSITTKLLLIIRNWSIFKAFGLRKCHIMFVQGRLRNFLKSVLYAQSLFFCIWKCDALLYFGRSRCDHCRRC